METSSNAEKESRAALAQGFRSMVSTYLARAVWALPLEQQEAEVLIAVFARLVNETDWSRWSDMKGFARDIEMPVKTLARMLARLEAIANVSNDAMWQTSERLYAAAGRAAWSEQKTDTRANGDDGEGAR